MSNGNLPYHRSRLILLVADQNNNENHRGYLAKFNEYFSQKGMTVEWDMEEQQNGGICTHVAQMKS
jgi:hypothetical protein